MTAAVCPGPAVCHTTGKTRSVRQTAAAGRSDESAQRPDEENQRVSRDAASGNQSKVKHTRLQAFICV